jgi:hypothetical protein
MKTSTWMESLLKDQMGMALRKRTKKTKQWTERNPNND